MYNSLITCSQCPEVKTCPAFYTFFHLDTQPISGTYRRAEALDTYRPSYTSQDEQEDLRLLFRYQAELEKVSSTPEALLYGFTFEKAFLILKSLLDFESEHKTTPVQERIKFNFNDGKQTHHCNFTQPFSHRPERSEEIGYFEQSERGMYEINEYFGFANKEPLPCNDARYWLSNEEKCASCKESTYRACIRNKDTHRCGKKHRTPESLATCSANHNDQLYTHEAKKRVREYAYRQARLPRLGITREEKDPCAEYRIIYP